MFIRNFQQVFSQPHSTENAEQMHSPSAGDLHTEILTLVLSPPPFKVEGRTLFPCRVASIMNGATNQKTQSSTVEYLHL